MTKKIFVIGCSYSHHDVYVKPNETWPALLQEKTGYTIVNCSIPGSSNFSYFCRLKEIEKQFGKPDQVIVQITGLHRLFIHLKNVTIQDISKFEERDYYYDLYLAAYKSFGFFTSPAHLYNSRILRILKQEYNISSNILKIFWQYIATDSYLEWQLFKEMQLIDLYYKNAVFFSWNRKYEYLEVKNYLGSLKNTLLKSKFDEYSQIKDKDDHFGIEGHKAVSEIIQKNVQV